MKLVTSFIFTILISFQAYSFKDDSHFSKTFNTTRSFRVFTPINYNQADTIKRYETVYYFHGCGGSYRMSGRYTYKDFGTLPPEAIDRPYHPDYEYPNNADFENVANQLDIIIICVDGKIRAMKSGCQVYFPSQEDVWTGNYYNFSVYIRELIEVVDERYNTKPEPQSRAISGLSMGGQMAIWVAATNPHLISSASEFCHAPNYYDVGKPEYLTTTDVKQLWRNLRGIPFRHTTTNRDYIRYFTEELYHLYSGAGFENEYYLADYCKHHAARIDLQFEFHTKYFAKPKQNVKCFSFINLYPNFDVWGYNISSSKKGEGWIYLRDVTKNGFGIYTRKRFPWGTGLSPFSISISTPAIYKPGETYEISRYSYANNSFSQENTTADSYGKLTIKSAGGIGEEIGIIGDNLQPPVIVLTDTVNENICLINGIETSLSFDVINLSSSPQTVDFKITTENNETVSILKGTKQITINPFSKKRINSMAVCKGKYASTLNNTGFIKISSSINGVIQDREHIIQIKIIKLEKELSEIKILDGKPEDFSLFKYDWSNWREPVSASTETIKEGLGNGNGKAEVGEIFSIWIKPTLAFDSLDINTWHATTPIKIAKNGDITIMEFKQHLHSTGRAILSAQIRLNRTPTKKNPVRITLQSEFLRTETIENDCHRNNIDGFKLFSYEIIINEDGNAEIMK